MPLNLEVNIDGMSVTKSSKSQIWPILVSVKEQGIEPALVAAYIGKEKPDPAILLNDFVDEMSTLMSRSSGFRAGNVSFTCDLPAKKMVKCCSSYTSYGSCDYCVVRGEHYKGRRIFLDQNAVLRTNEQFRSQVDRNFHTSNSPLLPLPIDMVNSFVIDYMHCVCLGVCRRLLFFFFILQGKGRLSRQVKSNVSLQLISLRECWPSEFSRKPRSLEELKFWKATEFRSFLLYSGPLVLKGLPKRHYQLFLLLHAGISLLCGDLSEQRIVEAEDILSHFVKNCATLLGKEFIVMNVHSLIHLGQQCRQFGNLDKFSAFKFENYLGKLKKTVRSANKPLKQIIRRLPNIPDKRTSATLGRSGKIKINGIYLSKSVRDSVFLRDKSYYKIVGTKVANGTLMVEARKFRKTNSFFDYPFSSLSVGVVVAENLSDETFTIAVEECRKCCSFPNFDSFIIFPFLNLLC